MANRVASVCLPLLLLQIKLRQLRDDGVLLGPQALSSTLIQWGERVQQLKALGTLNKRLASVVQPLFNWGTIQVRSSVYETLIDAADWCCPRCQFCFV